MRSQFKILVNVFASTRRKDRETDLAMQCIIAQINFDEAKDAQWNNLTLRTISEFLLSR